MKLSILLAFVIVFSFHAKAQRDSNGDNGYDRYQARKISFMTEQLELTPAQAQEFWPVYNEYERKRLDVQQKRREEEENIQENYDSYSENDFKKLNEEIISLYVEEAELMEEYNKKFLDILPAKKVVIIGKLENDFRYDMIREYSRRDRGD